MVSNNVQVNEEVDPVMVVRRLKAEIVELKEEIALLKGGEGGAGDVDEAAQDKIRWSPKSKPKLLNKTQILERT
jgi:kinesin family protein 6/9